MDIIVGNHVTRYCRRHGETLFRVMNLEGRTRCIACTTEITKISRARKKQIPESELPKRTKVRSNDGMNVTENKGTCRQLYNKRMSTMSTMFEPMFEDEMTISNYFKKGHQETEIVEEIGRLNDERILVIEKQQIICNINSNGQTETKVYICHPAALAIAADQSVVSSFIMKYEENIYKFDNHDGIISFSPFDENYVYANRAVMKLLVQKNMDTSFYSALNSIRRKRYPYLILNDPITFQHCPLKKGDCLKISVLHYTTIIRNVKDETKNWPVAKSCPVVVNSTISSKEECWMQHTVFSEDKATKVETKEKRVSCVKGPWISIPFFEKNDDVKRNGMIIYDIKIKPIGMSIPKFGIASDNTISKSLGYIENGVEFKLPITLDQPLLIFHSLNSELRLLVDASCSASKDDYIIVEWKEATYDNLKGFCPRFIEHRISEDYLICYDTVDKKCIVRPIFSSQCGGDCNTTIATNPLIVED